MNSISPVSTRLPSDRTHVSAVLNFIDPASPNPRIDVAGVGWEHGRNYAYDPREVPIVNGRQVPRGPALDWEGFSLYSVPTALTGLDDEDAIKSIYYPEIQALVKDKTGADDVVIFDHTIRIGRDGAERRKPVHHVHNDYTERSAPQRVIDLLGEEEGRRRLQGRYIQVNAWRPFENVVEALPLALADARSVREKDLIETTLDYGDRQGQIYELAHNLGQRWFYYPRMTPDEVILIKGFDSARDGRARLSPHTAFEDPTTPEGAAPRISMEVRTFAFFND
ncbi:CmcJ/NvfI family oxidoreductase [Hwanghaeella sp.]|uniref:CmcJ/NvfI family oxidoreductase n=1 Tax=Hwanghaeella sp. TaxID=2605943 RepID=UPI003CCBC29D